MLVSVHPLANFQTFGIHTYDVESSHFRVLETNFVLFKSSLQIIFDLSIITDTVMVNSIFVPWAIFAMFGLPLSVHLLVLPAPLLLTWTNRFVPVFAFPALFRGSAPLSQNAITRARSPRLGTLFLSISMATFLSWDLPLLCRFNWTELYLFVLLYLYKDRGKRILENRTILRYGELSFPSFFFWTTNDKSSKVEAPSANHICHCVRFFR